MFFKREGPFVEEMSSDTNGSSPKPADMECVSVSAPPGQAESPGFRQPVIQGAARRDGGPVGQLLLRPLLPGGQTETAGAGQQGGSPGEA